MPGNESLRGHLRKYGPLVQEFRRRAAFKPRAEVLRWFQRLSDLELEMISQQEELDAMDAAADDSATPSVLEQWITRLELLADAKDARRTPGHDFLEEMFGTNRMPGQHEREVAADLRRAPEWRAERKAEWERTKPTPRLLEAEALAASCWREDPVPERLKSIEVAQRRLGELVKQAKADGDWEEVMAISEYATSLYKLREALEWPAGDEGS